MSDRRISGNLIVSKNTTISGDVSIGTTGNPTDVVITGDLYVPGAFPGSRAATGVRGPPGTPGLVEVLALPLNLNDPMKSLFCVGV